jgi:type III secretion protein W
MSINDTRTGPSNFALPQWADSSVDQGVVFGSTFSLTDMAEEITSILAEKVEDKTLEERNIDDYKEPEIPDIVTIMALLGEMKDEAAANDIDAFSKRLIQAAQNRNSLLLAVRKWNPDPSKQYLALAHAINTAQGADKRVIEALRDELQDTLAKNGPAIRAGINTVEQAGAFGANKPAVDLFRATYRDAVLGQATLAETLLLLIQRFGDELEAGISLLRQALGADLAALQPSCEPEHLHAILEDLYQLTVAVTVLQRCRLMVDRLERGYPAAKLQALTLMQDIVKWTAESWIINYHATQLIEKYHLDQYEERDQTQDQTQQSEDEDKEPTEDLLSDVQIIFLNGLMDVLRSLPVKIFITPEHRLQAMTAVQQVLDATLLPEQ